MSHWSRVWVAVALLCTTVVLGPTPLRADYIVCEQPSTSQSRISCEVACQEGERLVQRSDTEWAGCGTEGPNCGTAWSEWQSETAFGGAAPPPDPCPAGCWQTETVDNEFRTVVDQGVEFRDLWQCQGVEAMDQ
jgi:hypothetical protein